MNLNHCEADALNPVNDGPKAALSVATSVVGRQWSENQSRFDIYCANHVKLTSTLFSGGDWHWRLTSASGGIIADCGGYRNEAQCLAVVGALCIEAGLAAVFTEAGLDLSPETKPRKECHALS